jgi:hypothetical protein
MSRIKPHGPVSPQFMTHHYGAAKPAPATDDTALLRRCLEEFQSFESGTGGLYAGEFKEIITALRERLGETK